MLYGVVWGDVNDVIQRLGMGWNRKSRGREKGYFYRSRRVGGRVVTQYVGHGTEAEQVAEEIALRHQQQQAIKAERAVYDVLDAALDRLLSETRLIVTAALIASGNYNHHGTWRRRHGCRITLAEGRRTTGESPA
jgi:hypothetical protein